MSVSPTRLQHLSPENAVRFLGHDTHAHDAPHLVYVAVGTAHLEVDGAPLTLHARESVWLAPRVPHSAHYEPGSLVLGPFLSPGTTPPVRSLRLGPTPSITSIMTTILGVAPHSDEQIGELRRALDDALTALVSRELPLATPTHPIAAAIAREALRGNEPLDVLAARHGASARHMQRVFVAQTGLSFGRWRVRARLNTAIARLRGGAPVAHVARAAGYASRSGLTRALRRELDPAVADRIIGGPGADLTRG